MPVTLRPFPVAGSQSSVADPNSIESCLRMQFQSRPAQAAIV
jgi:hypothetical protein